MSGPTQAHGPAPAPKASGGATTSRLLQRKCACGGGASALTGECEDCGKKRLQRKLAIGASNDPLELEADKVADRALSRSVPHGLTPAPLRVQRLSPTSQGQGAGAPPSVERVLSAPGRPLEPGLRHDMEGRFGHDFSRVRVHVGADAARSARDVSASAYTVGSHIVFGTNRFDPSRAAGRRLLAHELTHTLQQGGGGALRLQRTPGGDCGGEYPGRSELSAVGVAAHEQIQHKYRKSLKKEISLPRATKEDMTKGCPGKTRARGEIDLWSFSIADGIQIGEIKSVVASSEEKGREEVEHYMLRYSQLAGRVTGGKCATKDRDPKDLAFDDKQLNGRLQTGNVPLARPLDGVIPTTPTTVGKFKLDPRKTLRCQRKPGGAVVYWCNGRTKKDQEDEEKEQRDEVRDDARDSTRKGDSLLIPALIGTGLALGASLWAVHGRGAGTGTTRGAPAVQPPAAKTPPPAPPKPAVEPPKQATRPNTQRPHRPDRPRPPRGHRPANSGRPRGGAQPRGHGGGGGSGRGVRMFGGGLGAVLLFFEVKGLLDSFDDAKAQIAEMQGPYEALWKNFEKEMAQLRAASANAPAAVPAAPVVRPAPPAPPAPAPPPQKTVEIRLFENTRSKISERLISVPETDIGARYFPVTFWSLSDMGRSPLAIGAGRFDCAKLGTAGFLSGARVYSGYARPDDLGALLMLLRTQDALARLACVAAGASAPPTPAGPDGDEVTVAVQIGGADATGTCKRSVGASWTCSTTGQLAQVAAILKEDLDTMQAPSDFFLDVIVVRVRNGKVQRWDRNVSAWITDYDHPAPEPNVATEGSVPADSVDPNLYPEGSAVRFLLEQFYRTWGQ